MNPILYQSVTKLSETGSGGKSVVDDENLRGAASEIFRRYDTDASGTINSVEELQQMCLNLLYKIDCTHGHNVHVPSVIDSLNADEIVDRRMDFDHFVQWFVETFSIRRKTAAVRPDQ